MIETLARLEATKQPEAKMPKVWVGLCFSIDPMGEYCWPGYARLPLANGIQWTVPDDLSREQVRGDTFNSKSTHHGWELRVIGIIYFDSEGKPLNNWADFGLVHALVPGDIIKIISIKPKQRWTR